MFAPEVVVAWGRLRAHLVPRVGSQSLAHALSADSRYHFESIEDEGAEPRVMFVRDPVERMASAYGMLGRGRAFGDWIDDVLADPLADLHTWPQAAFVGPHAPRLYRLDRMGDVLREYGFEPLHVNGGERKARPTVRQAERIRAAYAQDVALYDAL